MIPYYILAIEDETDRAYMTALFFQYQKLMYSTIQKVTNDHWLIDDIFQTSFEHLIGKIDLLLGSGEINHSGSGENRQFWSNENHQSGVASPQVVLFTRPAAGQPVSQ